MSQNSSLGCHVADLPQFEGENEFIPKRKNKNKKEVQDAFLCQK